LQPLCPQADFGRTTDCVACLGAGTCSGTASDACARSARSAKLPTRVSKVARLMKADTLNSHHHLGPGPALRGSDGSARGVPGAAGRQRHRHTLDGRAVNSLNEGCTSGSGPEVGPPRNRNRQRPESGPARGRPPPSPRAACRAGRLRAPRAEPRRTAPRAPKIPRTAHERIAHKGARGVSGAPRSGQPCPWGGRGARLLEDRVGQGPPPVRCAPPHGAVSRGSGASREGRGPRAQAGHPTNAERGGAEHLARAHQPREVRCLRAPRAARASAAPRRTGCREGVK
jgi:hypothetical protein